MNPLVKSFLYCLLAIVIAEYAGLVAALIIHRIRWGKGTSTTWNT